MDWNLLTISFSLIILVIIVFAFLKYRKNLTPVKAGLAFGIIMALFMSYQAYLEYISCSPHWQSMCGVGIFLYGMTYGLFVSLLPLYLFGGLGRLIDATTNKDLGYILASSLVIIGTFITYFIIGYFITKIYKKLKKKSKSSRFFLFLLFFLFSIIFFSFQV